jgi:hypothetical protein
MQSGRQTSLAARGGVVILGSLLCFGTPMLLEKLMPPLEVLNDPSISNVHMMMPVMLIGIGIGLTLVIIDLVRTSGRME